MNVTTKFIIFISILLSIHNLAFGQIDNSPFYRFQEFPDSAKDKLYFSISHLSFNKDNEYFNKIADGYTLFGNQLTPSLIYFPASNVRIEGGIYMLKDFGNENYSQIAPILSVKWIYKNFSLILGSLEGSLNHNLVEPLYDFEKVMLNNVEDGLQIQFNNNKTQFDAWIHWENMLYRGDSAQEKVLGGFSSEQNIIGNENFNFSIPFQFTTMHLGGQIDASDSALVTKFNSALGFKSEYKLNHHFFHAIAFEPYYLYYNDLSFEKNDAFVDGDGLYLNLTLKTKLNSIMISYWKGNEYISTHGGLLYNSRSTTFKNPQHLEPNRELIILRFLTDLNIFEGFDITSRFEPHYDVTNKKIEFSLGLYINFKRSFYLKTIPY